jgi:peptidoglycan/LPS O-acetylase OafA/YrhL
MAALSVLFSHAFLIAEGTEAREPLYSLLGPGNIFGIYGVFTFFIISGFLLTRSLAQGADLVAFATNRVLRIVPGFAFCVAATALVIGPLVTNLNVASFYAQPETYVYIMSSLKCLCDSWETPFLFASDPKLVGTKNGSLWSLSYEVLSYIFLAWLWLLLRSPLAVGAVAVIAAVASWASPAVNHLMPGIAYTLPYFAAGILMYSVHQRFGTSKTGGWICFALLLASATVGAQHYAFAPLGAYLIVFLASRPNIGSRLAGRVGDLSYGVYLLGWPIQQLVQQFTGTRSGWELIAYSLISVLAAAMVSWWAVERPSLALKTWIRTRFSALQGIAAHPA